MGLIVGREPDQPVHPSLCRKEPIGVLALHGEGRALEPGLLARENLVQLGIESLALGPPEVHAEQHLGPVLGVDAPGAGVEAGQGVVGVVGA